MILIYIPCKDKEEAKKIARVLLEEKLIACANIVPEINSMYWWKEKIAESKEALLLCKTDKKLFKKIEEKVKEIHSYDIPLIASLKIDELNQEFLAWVESSLCGGKK